MKRSIANKIKALLLSACLLFALTATAAPVDELKAAYILNFAKLTTWPSDLFQSSTDPLLFCGFQNDPVMDALRALGERHIDGRPVRIRILNTPASNAGCHVLFFGHRSSVSPTDASAVRRRGLLLIGDSEGFIALGGTISYFLQSGKLRFEINTDNARTAELVLSARLLNLAKSRGEAP